MKRSAAAAVILVAGPAGARRRPGPRHPHHRGPARQDQGRLGRPDHRRHLRRPDRVPLQRHDDPGLHADRVARRLLAEAFERSPGLYDDVYVDLTFVNVIEQHGIEAPATRFADAFAKAGYQLWHANQMARHNLLRGLAPPASGPLAQQPGRRRHRLPDRGRLHRPDVAGPAAAPRPSLADRVGHIMNSGDGWYGGVFVATMYSQAFVRDDIKAIVTESLKAIPAGTRFRQTIDGVIALHAKHPTTGSAPGSRSRSSGPRTSAAPRACSPPSTSTRG